MPGLLKALIYTYTFSNRGDKVSGGSISILIQTSSF